MLVPQCPKQNRSHDENWILAAYLLHFYWNNYCTIMKVHITNILEIYRLWNRFIDSKKCNAFISLQCVINKNIWKTKIMHYYQKIICNNQGQPFGIFLMHAEKLSRLIYLKFWTIADIKWYHWWNAVNHTQWSKKLRRLPPK